MAIFPSDVRVAASLGCQHPHIFVSLDHYLLACVTVLILLWVLSAVLAARRRDELEAKRYPPVVHISSREQFSRPREAYDSALRDHGPIVGIWRKGKLEYIVDESHTKHVFSDDKSLSFEHGVATILNLPFVLLFKDGKFFSDLDRLVGNGVIPRMDSITEQVFPIFYRNTQSLVSASSKEGQLEAVDFFKHTHRCIAEAMLALILGERCITAENIEVVESIAHGMAEMTGIYQNTSLFARTFPFVWRMMSWIHFFFVTLLWKFHRKLGPHIWRELRLGSYVPLEKPGQRNDEDGPLIHYMARMYATPEGKIGVGSCMWISFLTLSLIFASVHQSAAVVVWVVYELVARPVYMSMIREELANVTEPEIKASQKVSYEALKNSRYLDSFIREVLRLKGDTLSTTRQTMHDTEMGNYIIPKGHLVYPLATLSHESRDVHGPDASVFNGFRWVDGSQAAATIGLGYFPFGLNRWACPGRILAVAEIKMIAIALLSMANPRLEGGKYEVIDPMNTTSVPPAGRLFLPRL